MIERLSLNDPDWLNFVTNEPLSTPFHHPKWASMIADCYGFDAFALALRAQDGERRLIAGIPVIETKAPIRRDRRWSSLPFTDVCAGLVDGGGGALFARGIETSMQESGVGEMEVAGGVPGVRGLESARYVQHVLHLEKDAKAVASRFRSSVRRSVRTGRSGELSLRRASGSELLDAFYGLHLMTRRRLGLPTQPHRFFRKLADEVLCDGLGHVAVVEKNKEAVAAAIFLTWNGSVVYKYGASDPTAWNLRPNHLIFADEIEAACLRGDHAFHFGRTDVDDVGLRRFKASWGADELPLTYVQFGKKRAEGSPPPELIRALIRHSPLFVTRSLGEALYRYVA